MSNNDLSQEFKNENLNVTVTRQPGSHVKFRILISPKGVLAAYHQAVKVINKEVSLPGFRKGKAPEALVHQHYAKHIDTELKEILLRTSFQESIDLTNIHPFHENSVKKPQFKSLSKEDGAELLIEFEASPEVPKVTTDELRLSPLAVMPVKEDDVEHVVQEIRLRHAEWKEITDRPVQEGDYVDVDIKALSEPKHTICTDACFEVVEGKMGAWMRKLIIGHHINDVVEGMSENEQEAHCAGCEDPSHNHSHENDPSFKPTLCQITIKKIKTAKLPELTPELLKATGVASEEELRQRIIANLEQQEKERVQEDLREQIEDQLAKQFQFDLPASLVESETKQWLRQRLPQYVQTHQTDDLVELDKQIKNDVVNFYRSYYLIHQFAKDHHIVVSSDELMQEYMRQVMLPQEERIIDPETKDAKIIRSQLYNHLISKKAKDFLIKRTLEKTGV